MHIARYLAMALGIAVAAIGMLGLGAPSVLLEFAQALQTANALYVVATVRAIFGAMLLLIAAESRTPRILRALGIFIIGTGVFTPLFGAERSRALLDWWSAQGSFFMRAWAVVAVAFGAFIVYAVTSTRRIPTH